MLNNRELNRFATLLVRQREIFVEEEELLLTAGFSKMVAFVQKTEAHIVRLGSNQLSFDVNQSVGYAIPRIGLRHELETVH
jgi:hypothetical protein